MLESGAILSGVLVQTVSGRIEQVIRGKSTSLLRHVGLRAGSLKMFVEETAGELVGAGPEKIEATLTRLVDRLAATYSLAYTPTNAARDGTRRRSRAQAPKLIGRKNDQAFAWLEKAWQRELFLRGERV